MKVVRNETPTSELLAEANKEFVVTDKAGRRITLKSPGVLAQYRLLEAAGESAKNEMYMAMVLPLIFVTDVDGEFAAAPSTKKELEMLIQRLGQDGINAVLEGVKANFTPQDPDADKAKLTK